MTPRKSTSTPFSFEELCEFGRAIAREPGKLKTHAAYKYLQREMPRLMARAPDSDEISHFHFVVNLITQYGAALGARERIKQPNQSRGRKRLQKNIDDLADKLASASAWLAPITLQALTFDLRAASAELKEAPAPKKRSVGYPELRYFVRRFLHPYRIADDATLLLEFADWAEIDCDERTAQRYIEGKN
jgi:hypothetical protein